MKYIDFLKFKFKIYIKDAEYVIKNLPTMKPQHCMVSLAKSTRYSRKKYFNLYLLLEKTKREDYILQQK